MSRSTCQVLQGTVQCSRGNSHSNIDATDASSSSSSTAVEPNGETKQQQRHHHGNEDVTPTKTIGIHNSATATTLSHHVCVSLAGGSPSTNDTNEEQHRRAAATEARRKRRLLLTRRQNSTSPRRSLTMPTKRRSVATIVPFAGVHDTTQTHKAVSATNTTTTVSPRCYPLIQPTIEGVENVAKRWKNGLVVAIPTECTYEACLALRVPTTATLHTTTSLVTEDWFQNVQQLRDITKVPHRYCSPSQHEEEVKDPYCIVTPGCELKRHVILREVFSPRLYALRPSDVDKDAVMCRFNETMEVLDRLASKLWPGPILMRLGLSSSSPWTRTPFVVEARPPRMDEENNVPNNNNNSNSNNNSGYHLQPSPPCYKNFITLRCPRHPLAVKARKDVAQNDKFLLVSLPVHYSPQRSSCSGDQQGKGQQQRQEETTTMFCTRARQVVARMAVLDGEDCREVFHVPTCEYQRPCENILWVDGRQRVVTVQSSAASVSPQVCNKAMVQAALRHFASKNNGNKKERMLIQAIMNKWKVVSCTLPDN